MAKKQDRIRIRGFVASGKGIGRNFVELEWVQKQFKEKLGFKPYPGTLNLILTSGEAEKRKKLEKLEGIVITPKKGYCKAKCFKAKIEGLDEPKAAVILPLVSNYPENLIEIISLLNLREKLDLKDGDSLEIMVYCG